MKRRETKIIKIFSIFTSLTLFCSLFAIKVPAATTQTNFLVQRLAGSNRYETSTLLSKYGWNTSCNDVVLATGEDFPDSLSAAPLAAKLNAPILLANKASLSTITKNELLRLKPKNAYIIGGQGVMSLELENEIRSMNINTIRVAGNDRYETSLKVAKLLGKSSTVFMVTGENFPDALSVASVAAKEGAPILLTSKDDISNGIKEYLNSNNIIKSYVIGGPAIISNNIFNQLPNCTRIYGNDRYETNINVLNIFSDELNLATAFISTGDDFPDALSCAPLAGISSSSIILVSRNESEVTKDFFKSINSFIKRVNILGGESVVPSKVIDTTSQSANAKFTLKIPTYDESGQACHPKVLYFPNKWNGFKYWMAMTPYPNGDDIWENPSIVASNSGTSWQVPKGLTNPVPPLPYIRGQHNSDPHLVFNQNSNQLELWYRYTLYDKEDQIYKMASSDGIHWLTPQLMLSFKNDQKCLSPAIIFEDNKYKMWYISQDFKCMYIENLAGESQWSAPIEVNFNLANSYAPWHIDVVHSDIGYEAIFCGSKKEEMDLNNRVLYSNVSSDGIHFNNSKIILTPSKDEKAWDNKQIYRSSFVKVDGIYKLFYSAMDKNTKWHIGLSQGYSLDDLHGYDGNIK